MFPLSCNFLKFAAVGVIMALAVAAHSPYAETLAAIDTDQSIASK